MNRRMVVVNPFREMVEMQRVLDRFFDEAGRSFSGNNASVYTLPVDVVETTDAYRIVADLPGVSEDAIAVSIDDNVLSIEAEFPALEVGENERQLINERRSGKYSRHLTLGKPVNTEATEAAFANGVLMLTLPFVPEVQPKQIAIKVSK